MHSVCGKIYLAHIDYVSLVTTGLELQMTEVILSLIVSLFNHSQPGDLLQHCLLFSKYIHKIFI